MTTKLFARVGIFALGGFVIASFAALFVVSRRVNVTIADEVAASSRGPDPLALVAADVASAREELHAATSSHAEQLRALAEELDESAARREADLRAEIAALRADVARLAASGNATSIASAASATSTSTPVPASATDTGGAPATTPLASEVSNGAAPGAAPTAPRKKSFLAFQSTGSGFRFDVPQHFTLLPNLSRVGFDAKSTLHDFSGACSQVTGEFEVDLSRPAVACTGAIRASAAALDTGIADRDAEMRKVLDVSEFPELRFDWKSFDATTVDAAAMKIAGTAHGELTLRGRARAVDVPVTVTVDAARRVNVDGELRMKLTDFGIEPPSKLGVIGVEDGIVVWIALRARADGPAKKLVPEKGS